MQIFRRSLLFFQRRAKESDTMADDLNRNPHPGLTIRARVRVGIRFRLEACEAACGDCGCEAVAQGRPKLKPSPLRFRLLAATRTESNIALSGSFSSVKPGAQTKTGEHPNMPFSTRDHTAAIIHTHGHEHTRARAHTHTPHMVAQTRTTPWNIYYYFDNTPCNAHYK